MSNQIVGRQDAFLCLLNLQSVFGDPVIASAGSNDKLQLWDVSSEWPMVVSVSQGDESRGDTTSKCALFWNGRAGSVRLHMFHSCTCQHLLAFHVLACLLLLLVCTFACVHLIVENSIACSAWCGVWSV